MDATKLLQALQMTMGPTTNDIKLAGEFLEQARVVEGFIPALLLIMVNKELHIHIRQQAAINIKTVVIDNWKIRNNINKISINDRLALKATVLQALISVADQKKLIVMMELVIKKIADLDFPKDWGDFLPEIINKLKATTDFPTIYGCLIAFKCLCKNYEVLLDEDRAPLVAMVQACFPLLEHFAQALLTNYTEEAALAMNCILKTFYYSVNIQLPAYLVNEKTIAVWMMYVKVLVEKDVPKEVESLPVDNDEAYKREKNIHWNNKKWCGRILQRFVQKHGNVKYETNETKGFATLYTNTYSMQFLDIFLKAIDRRKTHFVAHKFTYFATKNLYYALRNETLRKALLPFLETIMLEHLVPMTFITQKDEDDWQNDPLEYLRREEDFTDRTNNIKNVALDFIEAICKIAADGDSYLMRLMRFAAHVFTTNTHPFTNQPADLRLKEALLNIIGMLRDLILQNEAITDNMEGLLEKFVIPEFSSTVGFLRARACWLFGEFGVIPFKNRNTVVLAVHGITKCIQDQELPVKVKASISLNCVLEHKEAVELIAPSLKGFLEIYLNLMDKVDNEGIVAALEGVIESFSEHITPFAYDLIASLSTAYFKYISTKADEGDDDDDDGAMDEVELAAAGCLTAIKTILNSKIPQELFYKTEDLIFPILNYTLSEEGCDFIDDGLAILNSILYNCKIISEKMWSYFPVLNYLVAGKPANFAPNINPETLSPEKKLLLEQTESGWGYEYVEEMMGCFQNYIQKGKEVLLIAKDPAFNMFYVELLFKSIDKIIEVHLGSSSDIEVVLGTSLYICLIENYVGIIDTLIPHIIDKCMVVLFKGTTKNVKKIQLQTICMALWYNPSITLLYLIQKSYMETFFNTLVGGISEFAYDFEKRRIMFGLCALFKINMQEMPTLIASALPAIVEKMIKMTSELLELREKDDSDDEAEDDEILDDKAYQDTVKKLAKFNAKRNGQETTFADKDTFNKAQFMQNQQAEKKEESDDEEDDDEDEDYLWNSKAELYYNSPLENVCEILYFKNSLELLKKEQEVAYTHIVSSLPEQSRVEIHKNFITAEEQELEYQKNQQENLLKEQQQALQLQMGPMA
jgi:hypothetical protein